MASYFGSALISWGSYLGLASLLVLLVQAARGTGPVRDARWKTFLTGGALPYSWIITALCLGFVAHTPRSYDALLLAFDTSLGPSTSFILARLLAVNPLLRDLTQTIYHALPLGASCVLAWYNQSRFKPVRIIPMYVTMMILGYCLYWLYPAAGPAFAYKGVFPQSAPGKWEILSAALPPFVAPRNAMPSLHFGAMLLLMWNSRGWSLAARLLSGCFTCGIAFSTLALGEHYLIDLVVAFPFMLAVQSMWLTSIPLASPYRYQALLSGALATGAWLLALRWAIPVFLSSPALSWVCVLATIGGTVFLEMRLARIAWLLPAASAEAIPIAKPVASMQEALSHN